MFKINLLTDTDVTFLLTNGGHNAGIVSPPGHPRRHYRIALRNHDDRYVDSERWAAASLQEGSWWLAWQAWLAVRAGNREAPPSMTAPDSGYAPLYPAPGGTCCSPDRADAA